MSQQSWESGHSTSVVSQNLRFRHQPPEPAISCDMELINQVRLAGQVYTEHSDPHIISSHSAREVWGSELAPIDVLTKRLSEEKVDLMGFTNDQVGFQVKENTKRQLAPWWWEIYTGAPHILEEIYTGAPHILEEIYTGAPHILEEVYTGAPHILEEVYTGAPHILEGIYTGAPHILEEIYTGAPHILEGIYTGAPHILEEIYTGAPHILEEIYTGAPHILEEIYTGAPHILEGQGAEIKQEISCKKISNLSATA
ncbi:hypothetical protein STEG23_030760 [Scotinomys teguina]